MVFCVECGECRRGYCEDCCEDVVKDEAARYRRKECEEEREGFGGVVDVRCEFCFRKFDWRICGKDGGCLVEVECGGYRKKSCSSEG